MTGGGTGIGRAVALAFASMGANVAIANRSSMDAAEQVAQEIRAMGCNAVVIQGDVSQAASADAIVSQVLTSFGGVDIVVNNAGATRDSALARMSEQDWDTVIDVNLKGAFLISRAAIKPMMRQKHGKIVNVASVMGLMGNPGQTNYCASKFGLIGFTQALAKEVGSRNIQVNAVAPGFIETSMTDVLPLEYRTALLERIPAKRLGKPEDVVGSVVFLCSGYADYVTGQTLAIDGGLTA